MRSDQVGRALEPHTGVTAAWSPTPELIAQDLWRLGVLFVNVYFVANPDGSWALIDTGLPGAAGYIRRAAEAHFGPGARPEAIILTHGHFDHAGSAQALAEAWDVPIFAHALELPYLTGRSNYPPQDPTMGGAIAFMARFFPTRGYDFGDRVQALPESGHLPCLPGWGWLHTPGHSAGHVSLLRVSDQVLVAGDAVATMDLDSWWAMVTYERQLDRPAAPFTTDWAAARQSVERLAALDPQVVAAGHGLPITGAAAQAGLQWLAAQLGPPVYGRYVRAPAITDERGVQSVPPPVPDPVPMRLILSIAGLMLGVAVWRRLVRGR